MFSRDQVDRMPDPSDRDSRRFTGRIEFRPSKYTANPRDGGDPLDWHGDTRVALAFRIARDVKQSSAQEHSRTWTHAGTCPATNPTPTKPCISSSSGMSKPCSKPPSQNRTACPSPGRVVGRPAAHNPARGAKAIANASSATKPITGDLIIVQGDGVEYSVDAAATFTPTPGQTMRMQGAIRADDGPDAEPLAAAHVALHPSGFL